MGRQEIQIGGSSATCHLSSCDETSAIVSHSHPPRREKKQEVHSVGNDPQHRFTAALRRCERRTVMWPAGKLPSLQLSSALPVFPLSLGHRFQSTFEPRISERVLCRSLQKYTAKELVELESGIREREWGKRKRLKGDEKDWPERESKGGWRMKGEGRGWWSEERWVERSTSSSSSRGGRESG